MAILAIFAIALIAALVFGPQLWVKHVMERHGSERTDFPGTGGELARHLAEEFGLDVKVEAFDGGDHYDPRSRTVRLSRQNHDTRSLTAVAVAAHEIGHAIQHARDETGLKLRQALAGWAVAADRIAMVVFIAAPLLTLVARTPAAFIGMAGLGVTLLAIRVVVNLVTLPVEFDASFGKALPILKQGNYLHEDDLAGARQVLRAAALTYVAAAMMSLLNLARLLRR